MDSLFLFYVHGMLPHKVSHWSKPYRTLAACKGQVTRWTHNDRGERVGDRSAVIYRLDYSPDAATAPVMVPLETR